MRHRIAGRKLGRNTNQRRQLFRQLLSALIIKERVITTVAKAKAIKPLLDKLMVQAKTGTLAARRRLVAELADRAVADRLFKVLAPRTAKRTSGFTRIRRTGRRRGDNSLMAEISFVDVKEPAK